MHSVGLFTRIWISGRPPVTNLYSSAVFIGWAALLFALILEVVFQNGIGNIVAAILGSLTMYLAKQLSQGGDTLIMMEAVLDTQFWLATHVVCVTLGYTATYVTGLLGLIYIILGLFTPLLRDQVFRKSLSSALYAVLCFATLLSFVGTVLGGIWADYSWGRFWGWDPKENGALIIVFWKRAHPSCPVGRVGEATRHGSARSRWKHSNDLVLFWYESARRRLAFLWNQQGTGQSMRRPMVIASATDRHGTDTLAILGQLPTSSADERRLEGRECYNNLRSSSVQFSVFSFQ